MVRGLGVHQNLETWVGFLRLDYFVVGFVVTPLRGSIVAL
jgi:hypothetical protein